MIQERCFFWIVLQLPNNISLCWHLFLLKGRTQLQKQICIRESRQMFFFWNLVNCHNGSDVVLSNSLQRQFSFSNSKKGLEWKGETQNGALTWFWGRGGWDWPSGAWPWPSFPPTGEPRVVAVILDTGQIFAILSAYVAGTPEEISFSLGATENRHTSKSESTTWGTG